MADRLKDYLFSYDFHGERYSFTIRASSEAEARQRLHQMGSATLDGEVVVSVGILTGLAGLFGR